MTFRHQGARATCLEGGRHNPPSRVWEPPPNICLNSPSTGRCGCENTMTTRAFITHWPSDSLFMCTGCKKDSESGIFYHRCLFKYSWKSVFDGAFSFRHHSFRGDDHTKPLRKTNTTGSVSPYTLLTSLRGAETALWIVRCKAIRDERLLLSRRWGEAESCDSSLTTAGWQPFMFSSPLVCNWGCVAGKCWHIYGLADVFLSTAFKSISCYQDKFGLFR